MKYGYKAIFIFLLFINVFTSCKKSDDLMTLDNTGNENIELIISDSFDIRTITTKEDSFKTDLLSQFLVGKMYDPVFGESEASTYTQLQLRLLNNVIDKGNGVDSIFLILPFTSSITKYGDINSSNIIEIRELSEGLDIGRSYFSTDTVATFPELIGTYSGPFNYNDSLVFKDGDIIKKIKPGIKISLSLDFANKLLDASPSDLNTQTNFANYIKGIKLSPNNQNSPGTGAIAAFDLFNENSKIIVYYDNDKQIDYLINNRGKTFSNYKILSRNPEVEQQFNFKYNADTAYVQALGGSKLFLEFPQILNLVQNQRIFIHKAEIFIPVIPQSSSSNYPTPTRLQLWQKEGETGLNYPILDQINLIENHGVYDENKGGYTFGVTRHFQNILSSYLESGIDLNTGLFITTTTDFPITPARVMLDTRKDGNNGIKFSIIYSKL